MAEPVMSSPPPGATLVGQEPEQRVPPSRRERCLLGELPEDFLRVNVSRSGEHLVPLTYAPQAVYRPPSNHLGKLKVTIAQAKLTRNYGFTRMDPYCRVRIGHSVYETPTDTNGSKNPRWNKSFTCNLPRGVRSLYVEIFNERYLQVDDRIAWAYHELSEDLFSGETVEEWITLSGRQGESQEGNINLIFSFTPAPQQTTYQISAYGGQPVSVVPGPAQVFYNQPQQPTMQPYPQQPIPQSGGPESTQGPVVGPPRIRDEDVAQLKEMFPSLDEDIVRSVLDASNGQVDPALNNLLQMTAT